jgi:Tol biopolymer transport system component
VLPAISPDRTTVSYLKRNAADQFTPYLLDVATGEERPLESPCTFSTRPAWNPSGDQLALVCLEDGVATGMYIVDLDGNQIARVPTPGTPDGAPTWTSDDQLVYTQLGADANSPSTLWSINADGSSATPLTDGSTGWDHHPDWSEEAGLLLFSRTDGDVEYGNLGALDADLNPVAGGVSQDLEVAHPVWSPDGTEVAFTMLDDTRSPRLWVGPVDSSGEPTMVPGVEGAPGPPVWASR